MWVYIYGKYILPMQLIIYKSVSVYIQLYIIKCMCNATTFMAEIKVINPKIPSIFKMSIIMTGWW